MDTGGQKGFLFSCFTAQNVRNGCMDLFSEVSGYSVQGRRGKILIVGSHTRLVRGQK